MLWLIIAGGLLDPLTTKLDETVFLGGSFLQTETWALTRESEVTRGSMSLAHPNLFRLEYAHPEGRVTGYDGTSVYTVDPVYREVVVYHGSSPEGFLHLLKNAGGEGTDVQGEREDDRVTVRINGDLGGGIASITVGYSTTDSLPFFFSTTDVNGNRTEWELFDLWTEGSHGTDRFRLQVPPGFTLISQDN